MIHGNESVYPLAFEEEYGDYGKKHLVTINGLTKREHFAAMCLQGILSNPALYEIFANSGKDMNEAANFYALVSMEHADALIAELNK